MVALGETAQAAQRKASTENLWVPAPHHITPLPHTRVLTGSVPAFSHWAKILAHYYLGDF